MNNKVLVTGGSGFIGKYVTQELIQRGYEVHLISRNPASVANAAVVHCVDIFDQDSLDRLLSREHYENLIHLAWYVGRGCHSSNENIKWLHASLHLLESFQQNGGRVFVGAGTISEYEYKYGYLIEDITPTNPGTLYGETKNSLYKIAKAFSADHGIRFKWPRIFNLYGPGEKLSRLMPSVILNCLNHQDVLVSDCLKYQDYLYVEDTAAGIVDVFESDIDNAVNICSGEPVQLRRIVRTIARLCNYDGEIQWGAVPAAFDNKIVVGDNDRLQTLGWTQRYSLEDGLERTIHWLEAGGHKSVQ